MALPPCKAKHVHDSLQWMANAAAAFVLRVIVAAVVVAVGRCSGGDFRKLPLDLCLHLSNTLLLCC